MARADKVKFPDVHRENIHYGFRRNLWGLKQYGIAITAVAAIVVCADMAGSLMSHEPVHLAQPVIVAINLLLLLVWLFVVTRAWVKRAAMRASFTTAPTLRSPLNLTIAPHCATSVSTLSRRVSSNAYAGTADDGRVLVGALAIGICAQR